MGTGDDTKATKGSYISRGNGEARTGVVRWPDHLPLGDMGTGVYAVVPARPQGEDPFVRCLDVEPVRIEYGESADPTYLQSLFGGVEPTPANPHSYYSDPVLAAVCLGTCGRGFYDEPNGRQWQCTRDDLENAGRELCDLLERLYGRPVLLVTLIDT